MTQKQDSNGWSPGRNRDQPRGREKEKKKEIKSYLWVNVVQCCKAPRVIGDRVLSTIPRSGLNGKPGEGGKFFLIFWGGAAGTARGQGFGQGLTKNKWDPAWWNPLTDGSSGGWFSRGGTAIEERWGWHRDMDPAFKGKVVERRRLRGRKEIALEGWERGPQMGKDLSRE